MNRLIVLLINIGILGLLALPAAGRDTKSYALPAGAQVIEVQPIQSRKHPHRALILWMLNPQKVPRPNPGEWYAASEYTRGSHYTGPTRVSLVDARTGSIINTIKIFDHEGRDSFDIPYRLKAGYFYRVEGVPKDKEGKPTIMWLQDYNGDGHASEFPLFEAIGTASRPTTLIGYSESQNRVIQYTWKKHGYRK